MRTLKSFNIQPSTLHSRELAEYSGEEEVKVEEAPGELTRIAGVTLLPASDELRLSIVDCTI